MLERPPHQGYDSGRKIRSIIAASLDNATNAVLIVLVAAIEIAVGNADSGAKGIIY